MADSQRTSETLLLRIRAGEPAAWGRLVHLYGPLVRYWAGRAGAAAGDAEDVAQEVFAALASGAARYTGGGGGTFRGWLRGVTRFKAIDHLRAAGRHPAGAGGSSALERIEAAPDPAGGPDDDPPEAVSALYRRALDLIRSEFEDRTWEMFARAAVDGHPVDLIARDMGATEAAVRKAKSRVLRRLKEEVGDLLA